MNRTYNEPRFAGANWKNPRAKVSRRSKDRPTLKRKVVTTRIVNLDVGEVMAKVTDLLREGCEVRFNESIRLYPCMNADLKTMFVAAQTMGAFRNETYKGIKAKVIYRGREVNGAELAEKTREEAHEAEEARVAEEAQVTPDIIATCPKCGTRFRVGKKI